MGGIRTAHASINEHRTGAGGAPEGEGKREMLTKLTRTQSDSATHAADNAGIRTAIEQIGMLTRLSMTVEVTPSATLGGANQPDGLWRVMRNLRLEGGSDAFFQLPSDDGCLGGTLLHEMNRKDGFGTGHPDGVITAPSATFTPITFHYHAGARPRDMYGRDNPFDASAFVPASILGTLNALWVTSGADVMDDTVTISAATLRFTGNWILGSHEEIQQEMSDQNVTPHLPPGATAMVPAWTAEVFAHSATSSDYSTRRNVITGGYIKRIGLLVQDATATRTLRGGDEVTQVALIHTKTDHRVFAVRTAEIANALEFGSNLTADDAAAQFNNHARKGVYLFDLRPYQVSRVGRLYGHNMESAKAGDWNLGLSIGTYASGDDSLILYERYLPTNARLS